MKKVRELSYHERLGLVAELIDGTFVCMKYFDNDLGAIEDIGWVEIDKEELKDFDVQAKA